MLAEMAALQRVRNGLAHSTNRLLGRRNIVGALVAVAVAAGVVWSLLPSGSRTLTLTGSAPNTFTMQYSSKWKLLSAEEAAKFATHPIDVLARNDGRGVFQLRRDRSANGVDALKLARGVNAALKARLPDYQLVSAQVVQTSAGRILFYTYLRSQRGTLHTITIIPAGTAPSYVIDTVSNPAATDVSAQILEMVRSFALA